MQPITNNNVDLQLMYAKTENLVMNDAYQNMRLYAAKLECIVRPIIDIEKNKLRTPPSEEIEEKIRNLKSLAQSNLVEVRKMAPLYGNPVESSIFQCEHVIKMANIALDLRKEQALKNVSNLFAACKVAGIFVIASAVSLYFAYKMITVETVGSN